MTTESSSLWSRIAAVETRINALLQRLQALEVRFATIEQQLGQRWYS